MKKTLLLVAFMGVAMAMNAQQNVETAVDGTATIDAMKTANADASAAAAAQTKKASYWKKGFDVALTGTQNFVSQNTNWSTEWYNGGSSNLAGLFNFKGWYNYEGPQGLMWDNLVELKYGIGTQFSKDKAGRAWHLSDDKTSYSTKLGYAIGKGWHVAWNADLNTTLFRNYASISDNRALLFYPLDYEIISSFADPSIVDAVTSSCVSPLRFTTGIGVDWKYTNEAKNIDLSIYIAPYAYKLVYVEDMTKYATVEDDAPTLETLQITSIAASAGVGQTITDKAAYDAAIEAARSSETEKAYYENLWLASNYVTPNHHKSYNVGSLFDVQYRQKFNDYVSLESRLQFYTDYKGIEVDWNITADFKLVKYLTARISVNPRYDSTVAAPEGKTGWDIAKLQLKELFSLGLSYRFEK